MQEVFEKIIKELEIERTTTNNTFEKYEMKVDLGRVFGLERAIEIVKQEAEQYNNGHFGCNTNGEHEKCNGCGLTDCKNRNKIWFGVSDDNNGWISCSEKLPDDFMSFEYLTIRKGHTLATITYYCVANHKWYLSRNSSKEIEVIAWQPLPEYHPRGEEGRVRA